MVKTNNGNKISVIIYVRVSTEKQTEGMSEMTQRMMCERALAAQQSALKAAGKTLRIESVVYEHASGYKMNSQVKLSELLRRSPEGTFIVVARADRLCRNTAKFDTYLDMAEKRGIVLSVCLEEQDGVIPMLFTNDEEQEDKIYDLIVQAENEARAMAERQKNHHIMLKKLQKDVLELKNMFCGGTPPYGYQVQKVPWGDKMFRILVENPEEQRIIKRIVTSPDEETFVQLAGVLNSVGDLRRGLPWTPKQVKAMYLKQPIAVVEVEDLAAQLQKMTVQCSNSLLQAVNRRSPAKKPVTRSTRKVATTSSSSSSSGSKSQSSRGVAKSSAAASRFKFVAPPVISTISSGDVEIDWGSESDDEELM